MYSIHSSMNPKCTNENEQVKNNIQLGATGDVRPCNYYGTRLNWQYFEKWAIDKGFDLTKLNIRNSTMKEIYESDVFKAILDGHETLDLPEPCIWHCRKISPQTTGYKETGRGYNI
tara:strand:- start:458 stop:805 length:348 start_codon:yes stop_codon:yes gene_type:complete